MEILKGKKNSKPEINPFAGEQSSGNQTVIYLDKWVNDAKAYKDAYEANKEDLDVLTVKINNYYEEEVERISKSYPVNLIQYTYPYLVNKENLSWNKGALYLMFKSDELALNKFERYIGNELLEFIGVDKIKQEELMIQHGWTWREILDYAIKSYNDGDY
jgi:hypothetical protein